MQPGVALGSKGEGGSDGDRGSQDEIFSGGLMYSYLCHGRN